MKAPRKMFWRCPVCQGVHELSKDNFKSANAGERTFKQFCSVKLMLIEIGLDQLQTSRDGKTEIESKSSKNGWA